jgi:hypothetical protein
MSVPSDASVKASAASEKWEDFAGELRAVVCNERMHVMSASINGGPILIYVPGGMVQTGVQAGSFVPASEQGFYMARDVDYTC